MSKPKILKDEEIKELAKADPKIKAFMELTDTSTTESDNLEDMIQHIMKFIDLSVTNLRAYCINAVMFEKNFLDERKFFNFKLDALLFGDEHLKFCEENQKEPMIPNDVAVITSQPHGKDNLKDFIHTMFEAYQHPTFEKYRVQNIQLTGAIYSSVRLELDVRITI